MIDLQEMKKTIHYSPAAGVFEKRVGSKRSGYKWILTGSVCPAGYMHISHKGRRYLAHRLAWCFVNGEWPEMDIDHIDGDKLNNAISNLRLATTSQNAHNTPTPSHNVSGIKGVSYCASTRKWIAQVSVNRRPVFMRGYKTKEEAEVAVREARKIAHGEFANHGTHKFIEEELANP